MDLFYLFTLDASSFGGSIFYFHEYDNEVVVYENNNYQPIPIETDGFEVTSKGLPTPTIKVGNVMGLIGSLVREFDGLQGAKITRTTLKKQLPGYRYTISDTVGLIDAYVIDRPTSHTNISISFELRSILDLNKNKVPKRTLIQSTCPLVYGSAECGVPKTATFPTCPRNIAGCVERVQAQTGEGNPELPFGGFTSIGRNG